MSGVYPCYRAYQAADGRWLVVGALEPPFWSAFCRGLGRDDLVARQYDPSASAEVASVVAGRDSTAWLAHFEPDACVALVNLPREALADRQVQVRAADGPVLAPAPRLGADTDDILAEAAVEPTLVRRLARRGVISGPQSSQRAARAARLGSRLARMTEHDPARAA